MRTDALEPGLTKTDLRVLAAIPQCGPGEWRPRTIDEAVTLWGAAEALDTTELADVQLMLNGLEQLGYVWSARSESRSRIVYWRTPKGDEAVSDD